MTFLVLVFTILIIGLIMLFSASYAYAYYYFNNSLHFISRQLLFAVVGACMMIAISHIDYHILKKLAWPIYAAALVLLVVVLFMPKISGVHRWINLKFTTFQPSEIAKFSIVIVFALLISKFGGAMKSFKYGILPFIIILGIVCSLMVLEPHISGTILILGIGAVMMFAGGADLKYFIALLIVAALAVVVVIIVPTFASYASSRVQYWLDPYSDMRGLGYQTLQSLYAIGSGGLMGVGIGNSRQKYLYLPEPHNDFIFAVVCEELGFVGAAIIIILFALLVWRGLTIAMRAKDRFGAMLALGLTAQVGIQTLLNIAVVTNTIPNTGIGLPFFSYGGTALLMLLFQMGVVLSVSRFSTAKKNKGE